MSATITLRQQQQVYQMCSGQDKPVFLAPQWDYVAPTPDMETRGLTPQKLREILDGINEKSKEHYIETMPLKSCKGKLRWIQLAVILLGAIFMIDANTTEILSEPECTYNWYGGETCSQSALFSVGAAIVGVGVFWWLWSVVYRMNVAYAVAKKCEAFMKQYVEEELNEQWQKSKMIRWAITVQTVPSPSGKTVMQVNNIEVTSLVSQTPQMVQIPMQMQGQQMVMQQVNGQQVMMQPVVGQQVMGQPVAGQGFVVVYQNTNLQTQTATPPSNESEAPPAYTP